MQEIQAMVLEASQNDYKQDTNKMHMLFSA